jgi:drug/metabolite transporter (DMT)-like permease
LTSKHGVSLIKTFIFTGFTLIAFAANSVLCRMALGEKTIDAYSFTVLRLLSGAIVLFVILKINHKKTRSPVKGSWFAGTMLFLYAVTFSIAYTTLDSGTGAIILFGSVQITMISLSIISGYRLHIIEWIGVLGAFTGFVYLVLPGATSPSVIGFSFMTIAGIAWGVYTLKGRDSVHPFMDTAHNFLRTIPFVMVLAILAIRNTHYTTEGILLALSSGSIASGLGYTIWYKALSGLSATQAAVVQLLVPVIVALGGVIFLNEEITLHLTLSAIMILGGILMVVWGQYYFVYLKLIRKRRIAS